MMVAYMGKLSFVAAAVALQNCPYLATASDGTNLRGTEDGNALGSPSGHSGGFLFDHNSFIEQALSGFLGFLGPSKGFPLVAGASVKLSIPEDEKTCHVKIVVGKDVTKGALQLTLNPAERKITATYKEEEAEEKNEPGGKSFSSRTIHSMSSLLVPVHCIATSATLLSHLGGYILDAEDDGAGNERHGRIVFPSVKLLREHIEQGTLPANILDVVTEGRREQLDQLTPGQLCLAAGFTTENCQKLGDKKPEVADVEPFDSSTAIPIPRYHVSAKLLVE